jgi:hypothetical protein
MEVQEQILKCINCGETVAGKYCANCRQRADIKRITLKESWNDFWSRIYGFDGLMPRTLRDLTIRLGKAALAYLQGNRVKYYGPVGYFFLMVTLFVLLLGILDLDYSELVKETQKSLPFADQQNMKMAERATEFFVQNLKLVLFLGVPFQALASRYFMFRKAGLNVLEHSVLPFYVAGHMLWLSIVILFVRKISGVWPSNLVGFVAPIYLGWAYVNFFPDRGKVKTFFKGLGVYLVGQLLFMMVVGIATVIFIVMLAWLDPETFETFRPSKT